MARDESSARSDGVALSNGHVQLSENAKLIIEKRYLRRDEAGAPIEAPEELFGRVARAVALAEEESLRDLWAERFLDLMASLKFLPNSPTLVNAGTGKGCLSACFVISPEDSMDSIMQVAYDAAMIEKWGGGIGFGFSKLRPKNDKIATTHGQACGPIAVMKLYSTVGATLTQGAFRLGAHMGQLRDSHPDVQEFIHCKDGDDGLQNFNISVQITDAFMQAVEKDDEWPLVNTRDEGKGPLDEIVGRVSARELWNEIVESAWKTGDPGVVFIDRVWESAPNPQMGRIETSNPCGEEFLENYGNCCLGSINLDRHVGEAGFDWEALEETVRTSVRFPGRHDRGETNSRCRRSGRSIWPPGVSVSASMGWADALVRLNIPYDSDEALDLADRLGAFLNRTAWDESRKLAEERGPFPRVRTVGPERAGDASRPPFQRDYHCAHRYHQPDSRMLQRNRATLRHGLVVKRTVERAGGIERAPPRRTRVGLRTPEGPPWRGRARAGVCLEQIADGPRRGREYPGGVGSGPDELPYVISHHSGVARPHAGGMAEACLPTQSPRPSISPTAPVCRMSGTRFHLAWEDRVQGGHGIPRRLQVDAGTGGPAPNAGPLSPEASTCWRPASAHRP